MKIKDELFEYTKSRTDLDYPTYRDYVLFLTGETNVCPDMKKRPTNIRAKKLIDEKYKELLNANNTTKKEIEEKPVSKKEKKKRVSNVEEFSSEFDE